MEACCILVVEDEPTIGKDLQMRLTKLGYHVPEVVDSGEVAIFRAEALRPALILMDIALSGKIDGVKTAETVRDRFDIPVVYLTGYTDDETFERARITDPFGYIIKPYETMELQSTIAIALHTHELQRRIREQKEWFQTTLGSIGEAVIAADKDGAISFLNSKAEELTGWSIVEAVGKPAAQVFRVIDGESDVASKLVAEAIAGTVGRPEQSRRLTLRHRDGSTRPIEETHTPIRGGGIVLGAVIVFHDITKRLEEERERRLLDAQIQQTQKLESLGLLAGGVAHDFNNLLMGILGNAGLALMEIPSDSAVGQTIRQIELAALRAGELCKQLLDYSGRGQAERTKVNLSELVKEIASLLEVAISKRAVLSYDFAANLPEITGDPTQIRQVVMNLLTNASESLGNESGAIRLSTRLIHADEEFLASAYLGESLEPGAYVVVEVSDTGHGMDDQTMSRIFDPFFTTKSNGRGLGLAASLGIVRSHEGAIRVQSMVGQGTKFVIMFPCRSEIVPAAEAKAGGPAVSTPNNRGVFLVVDDDQAVLSVAQRMLEKFGFSVHTAIDGARALELFRDTRQPYVGVLLDLTMPNMTGDEVMKVMRRLRPEIPVILSSGFSEADALIKFGDSGLAGFLQKPYGPAELLRKVRETLE